jgi:hypothetical protein
MKTRIIVGVGVVVVLVVVLAAIIGHHEDSQYTGAVNAGSARKCHGWHADHAVVLNSEHSAPRHLQAKLCDTLTLSNDSDTALLLAFGPHYKHVQYAGTDEHYLYGGKTLKVVLAQPGTFEFHDHLRDKLTGYFTVK